MWAGGGNTILEHKVVVIQWEAKVVLEGKHCRVQGKRLEVPRYKSLTAVPHRRRSAAGSFLKNEEKNIHEMKFLLNIMSVKSTQ